MIEVGDYGEVLSEDTVQALSLLAEPPTAAATLCHLSVDAMASTEDLGTFRLRALVGNQVMVLLVDLGSTHTFVDSSSVARAQCKVQEASTLNVKVANGQFLKSTATVIGLSWWCQGTAFTH